jgi:hypothetical protein
MNNETMTQRNAERLARWHDAVFNQNMATLAQLLDDEVVFHSPVAWTPTQGKLPVMTILRTVGTVFQDFAYHRELMDGDDWALEFSAKVGDLRLKGIDLIHWNDKDKIETFEVMVRPANALQALGAEMGRRLAELKSDRGG